MCNILDIIEYAAIGSGIGLIISGVCFSVAGLVGIFRMLKWAEKI